MLFVLTNSGYPYAGRGLKRIYCNIRKRGNNLPYYKNISKGKCRLIVKVMDKCMCLFYFVESVYLLIILLCFFVQHEIQKNEFIS